MCIYYKSVHVLVLVHSHLGVLLIPSDLSFLCWISTQHVPVLHHVFTRHITHVVIICGGW
jgi:hypothetical protein